MRKIGLAVWVNQRAISSITSGGELIAEVEKDKSTSGEQLLIRHMVSFRHKYTYRPITQKILAQGFRPLSLLPIKTGTADITPWREPLRLTLNVSTRKKASLPVSSLFVSVYIR